MAPYQLIREARLAAGLTQAQLAARSGTSQATLSAYEGGAKSPSATTLARILAAAGRRLTTTAASRPVVRPGRDELERRGRVLAQVLDLAERLPFRPAAELRYPPLRAR
jgi:transcriptional regulator with XRE-family HTH domain